MSREQVLHPRPSHGVLRVVGPDRVKWLDGVLTAAIAGIEPGHAAWSLALTKTGKIVSEILVGAEADAHWLACAAGTAPTLFAHLERLLVMEDAELSEARGRVALLEGGVAPGGAAPGVRTFALDPPRRGALLVAEGEIPWAEVAERLGAILGDEEAWAAHRLDLGVPELGRDFTSNDNPHEASLERRTVSWTKGCYLGQEVVCMQDMRGKVKRRVVLLEGEGELPAGAGSVDGPSGPVGEVTTRAALRRDRALARVASSALAGPLRVGGVPVRVVEPS